MCEAGREGVYVIGQAGLEQELRDEGLRWKGGTVCLLCVRGESDPEGARRRI